MVLMEILIDDKICFKMLAVKGTVLRLSQSNFGTRNSTGPSIFVRYELVIVITVKVSVIK